MTRQPVAHLFADDTGIGSLNDEAHCKRCGIEVAEWLALIHSESLLKFDCDAVMQERYGVSV